MQVNNTPGEILRPDAVQKTQGVAPVVGGQGESAETVRRSDHVQLSDVGLALASDTTSESSGASTLDAKRADDIRGKILSGAYNSLSMAHLVAQSILKSGDL